MKPVKTNTSIEPLPSPAKGLRRGAALLVVAITWTLSSVHADNTRSRLQASASCPAGPFAVDPVKIAAGFKGASDSGEVDAASFAPDDRPRVRNGAFGSAGGDLAAGDGSRQVTQWGLDLDRRLFFSLETWDPSPMVPPPIPHSPDVFLQQKIAPTAVRISWIEESGRIAVLTTLHATPRQVARFGCLANALIAIPEPKPSDGYVMAPIRDGWSGLDVLRDAETLKVSTGAAKVQDAKERINDFIFAALAGTAR